MNASSLSKTSEQTRANEPSMEEILASIRRIIADDRMLPLTPRAKSASESAPAAEAAEEPEAPAAIPVQERRAEAAPERTPDMRSLRVLPGGLPPAEAPAAGPRPAPTSEEFFPRPALEDFLPSEEAELAVPAQADEPEAELIEESESEEERAPADPLLSAAADASVASSFQSLAATVFLQNTELVEQSLRDLLRPLLKQWLDENLPSIVERLVRAEIERVARGRRA
jgi:uncharacterized protein